MHNTEKTHNLEEFGYKQELRRSMSLSDVVVFGLIYMVPLAPLPVFGLIYNFSNGMAALVYIVAAIAMIFSAISYAEMAKRYPIAGSVYSYVQKGMNPFIGFIAGWAILLDYLLLPALLSVFAATAMVTLLPSIPAWVWVVVFVILAATINLRGVKLTAGMNKIFLTIQMVVLGIFVIGALIALANGQATLSWSPIYQSTDFNWTIVFGAIPLAALSFIGFDAISTLNEEAKGGGETVSKATMIVLVVVTVLFVAQVYLAALFVPTGTYFSDGNDVNNAFYNLSAQVVAPWFKVVITLTSALVAIFANSIASQATSSRLVFSMARDGKLPKVLAWVNPKTKVPQNAMLFIAILSLIIGVTGSAHQGFLTTLVTFGALTAYILLNLAVLVHFGVVQKSQRFFAHWISPVLGTAVLGYALWNTEIMTKIIGVGWLLIGIAVAFYFQKKNNIKLTV